MRSKTLAAFETTVPDSCNPEKVGAWADALVMPIMQADLKKTPLSRFDTFGLDDVGGPAALPRFVNMAMLADWVSYAPPLFSIADRCLYQRMDKVVRSFPRGFQIISCQHDDLGFIPIGYTGWYPIAPEIFDKFMRTPEQLTDRGQAVALAEVDPMGCFVYLFNYSIVQPLRHSKVSKKMLEALTDVLSNYAKMGAACVTVSEDGRRIARRYGLKKTGVMTHMGETEDVLAAAFDPPVREVMLHPKQTPERAGSLSARSKA